MTDIKIDCVDFDLYEAMRTRALRAEEKLDWCKSDAYIGALKYLESVADSFSSDLVDPMAWVLMMHSRHGNGDRIRQALEILTKNIVENI